MGFGRLAAAALLSAGACIAMADAPPTTIAPGARGPLADILARPDLDGVRLADASRSSGPPGAIDATRATVVVVFASWCPHCHEEIELLGAMRAAHPGLRVIGVNYRGHEEYDARGNPQALRDYVRNFAPWMPVVPADEALFGELGRPPKIPTMYLFDGGGALVTTYDRRWRAMPDRAELETTLARLGA